MAFPSTLIVPLTARYGSVCRTAGHWGATLKKKKNRRRKARQRRSNQAARTTARKSVPTVAKTPVTIAGGGTRIPDAVDDPASPSRPWSLKEMLIIGAWALGILSFLKDYSGMLDVVEGLVEGYRTIYSSVWRTVGSYLPPWLRPFDAPQTYDAMTFLAIMTASLIGARQISRKGLLYDYAAAAFLTLPLQFVSIKIWDRTPYDVVATTTVNIVIVGLCLGFTLAFRMMPELKKSATLSWSPLGIALSTMFLMVVADDPRLFADTLLGTLPPTVDADLGTMRHVLFTALALVNLGGALVFLYTMRGPRRPLFAYSLALAAFIFVFAVVGGVIEKALQDANVIPTEDIAPQPGPAT